MSVLSSFVLFVAVLGCHASDLSQDDGWVAVTNKLQAEANKLATLVKELKKDNDARKTENEAIKAEVERLRNRTLVATTPACFSAVKTKDQIVAVGGNILFDEVLIDTHDTFSGVLGVYGIPQTGIWEVIFTLFKPYGSPNSNQVYGDLYVDSTFQTRIEHMIDYNWDATQSTATIIRVFNAGDTLRVEASKGGTFFGSTEYKASQFSAKFLGEYP